MSREGDNLRRAVWLLAQEDLGRSSRALIGALALGHPVPQDRWPLDSGDLGRNWRTYELLPEDWKPRAHEIITEWGRHIWVRSSGPRS